MDFMFQFEGEMIKVMLNATSNSTGFQSFPNVNRSFGDIAKSTILGDVAVMAIGNYLYEKFAQLLNGIGIEVHIDDHQTMKYQIS